jgi:hypothetical protein
MICERRASHCKVDDSMVRNIEKRFPGILLKALQMLEQIVSMPEGTILKEILCKYV